MNELLDVLKVTVLPEYRLALEFENGEHRLFDMSPYMEKTLRETKRFARFQMCLYRLWDGGLAGKYRYCTGNAL